LTSARGYGRLQITWARKGVRTHMARFQTKIADLLEMSDLPGFTKVDYRGLGKAMGVSPATVEAWLDARVGSDKYLHMLDGSVLEKMMAYFGVGSEEIVVIILDNHDADEVESPQPFQETASFTVALAAA